MAQNRTINPNLLTEVDRLTLETCREIGQALKDLILDPEGKRDFHDKYAKISMSRDAGAGVGGGKLQRDALTTRGKTDKTPISNRNLRWHPLVVAAEKPDFATEISRISIEGVEGQRTLSFWVTDENGNELKYAAGDLPNLKRPHVALPRHWEMHNDLFQTFTDTEWSNNRCVISAMEYSPWEDALESYAALALAASVEVYDVDFDAGLEAIREVMKPLNFKYGMNLPSAKFPRSKQEAVECPLCKKPFSDGLEEFRYADRLITWQPTWVSSRRSQGDDASLQIMHVEPLNEKTVNHHAGNVRFGHRWCNVTMTDHSLPETIAFFRFVEAQH
jgi:hypothetical protein